MSSKLNFLCCFVFALTIGVSGQSRSIRQVILLSMNNRDSSLLSELKWLTTDSKGMVDRDLKVKVLTRANDSLAYSRLKPKGPFTFILIGKDGGEKYRSGRPVTAKALFAIVDAMPMRQEEMRKSRMKD